MKLNNKFWLAHYTEKDIRDTYKELKLETLLRIPEPFSHIRDTYKELKLFLGLPICLSWSSILEIPIRNWNIGLNQNLLIYQRIY